jgi:hypothetical protein
VDLWSVGLAFLKGAGQQSGNPVCLWIPGLTGLVGVSVQQNGDRVCVGGGSPVWQGLGAQGCGVNIVQGCACLGDMAQWNGDHTCLYLWCSRPWGSGLADQRSCRAVQSWVCGRQCRDRAGWGAQPSETELLQGCAGLGGVIQQRS